MKDLEGDQSHRGRDLRGRRNRAPGGGAGSAALGRRHERLLRPAHANLDVRLRNACARTNDFWSAGNGIGLHSAEDRHDFLSTTGAEWRVP